jgi:NAD(P)-dependent dehydrogenase (short-subunit alcohol dehydrogenase family)
LDRLYSVVKAEKGKLDILFANAAIADGASLEQVNEEHFDRHFDINVKGIVFTCRRLCRWPTKVLRSSSRLRSPASKGRLGIYPRPGP